MVRSMTTPGAAGDQESERNGDRQRIVEQRRIAGADELLHHEGRVGAEHHHLAMRHVDDAHHAEGDGEPDRRQQQHRAEREPVPGVLHGAPDRQRALDLSARRQRGLVHGVRLVGRQAVDQAERILVAAVADDRDGEDLVGHAAVVGGEHDGGARLGHRLFHARIGFRGERLVERRQNVGRARLEHRLRGVVAPVGIGGHQRQSADRRVDHAAQPVIEADRIDIVGRRAFGRLAGRGVEQRAVFGLDVDLLVLGAERQPPLLQRLDQRPRQRAAAGGDRVDRIGGVAEIVGGEARQRVLVGAGIGKAGAGDEQAEGDYERYDAIVGSTHGIRSRHHCFGLEAAACAASVGVMSVAPLARMASGRPAALLGDLVVVAALQRHPIGLQVLRTRQEIRPGVAGHQALGLPHHVELAVGADFAHEHRLGDVMVGQHLRHAAGQIRRFDAGQRGDDLVRIGGLHLLDRLDPHGEADHVGFHRIVGGALRILGEGLPVLDERGIGRGS